MSTKLAALISKRQQLVAHAATQRAQFAERVERLHTPLAIADGAYRVARAVRRHPAVSAAATVAMFTQLPQHRVLLWAGRVVTLWELYRVWRGNFASRRG